MTHPDLLTDEDIATRHEPKKRWFNQFLTVWPTGVHCEDCNTGLSNKPGDIFFSCCPATFDSYEEAVKSAEFETVDGRDGDQLAEYMGTFEL